jgi:hypothetical protein
VLGLLRGERAAVRRRRVARTASVAAVTGCLRPLLLSSLEPIPENWSGLAGYDESSPSRRARAAALSKYSSGQGQ